MIDEKEYIGSDFKPEVVDLSDHHSLPVESKFILSPKLTDSHN